MKKIEAIIIASFVGLGLLFLYIVRATKDWAESIGDDLFVSPDEKLTILVTVFACMVVAILLQWYSKRRGQEGSIKSRMTFTILMILGPLLIAAILIV
ncbi:hypothetical protein CR969_02500 [Candidatus Saccharibacteria bacterium]|nr:MAG: hypothetical protein CR969_02500 [Candidatus Saccharibacteria bacterium]